MLKEWYHTNLKGKEEGLLYKISYSIGLAVAGASYVFIICAIVFIFISLLPMLVALAGCAGSCSAPSISVPTNIPDVSSLASTAQEIGSTMVQTATETAQSAAQGLENAANTLAEQSSQGLMVTPYKNNYRLNLPPINYTSSPPIKETVETPPSIQTQPKNRGLFEWIGYIPFWLVVNTIYYSVDYTGKGIVWLYRFVYKDKRILIDPKTKQFMIEDNSNPMTYGGGNIEELSNKTVSKMVEWIKKWFGGPIGVKIVPKSQSGGNKIFILGRHRVVKQKGRGKYITYKGQLISLTEAKKLEKKFKKK